MSEAVRLGKALPSAMGAIEKRILPHKTLKSLYNTCLTTVKSQDSD